MNKIIALLIGLFSLSMSLKAQSYADSTSITISGFVKADYVFDTRQIVDSRENLLLFYPKDNTDAAHDKATYNQYALISRLRANISGVKILNAASEAVIEGDFSGVSNNDIDGFRLRHAYFRLSWDKASVLLGQYWHPLTVPEAFPAVLSLNIGAPFHAFNRGPQLRFEYRPGKFKIIGAVISQRDFANDGPLGYTPQYMYQGGLPDFHAQLHFSIKNWTMGAGGGYKTLAPAFGKYGVDKTLSSFSAVGFVQLQTNRSRLLVQSVYGQNSYDHLMMGGYAMTFDSLTQHVDYRNIPMAAFWADYTFNLNNDWKAGLFLGYTTLNDIQYKNDETLFARGANIEFVSRISPRIIKNVGNLTAGLEGEYTNAWYRDVSAENLAENYRLSLIFIYRF
ncbi:MAG: hypothetical protein ACQESZ_09900 [Bacteroidota bacterium]